MTVAATTAALALLPSGPALAAGLDLYVSTSGSDTSAGTTPTTPLRTIQAALNRVVPGSTVHLAPGTYTGSVVTEVDGTALSPITIEGTDTGLDLTKRGATTLAATSRVFSINNSYYHLSGFTIDGEPALKGTAFPGSLAAVEPFKDSVQSKVVDSGLIFVGADDSTRDLTGIVIDDMSLQRAGNDCIRMANGAHDNIVENSTIQWCGMLSNTNPGVYDYHNGEGVYLGTSPKSTNRSMSADDDTSFNLIENNVIKTFGSECLDVKENAHDNTLSGNYCGFNDEPLVDYGSLIEIRGYRNTITDNTITASRGYGLKLESDSSTEPQGHNVVTDNTFSGLTGSPISNKQITAQGQFCGNSFKTTAYLKGNSVGNASASCG